MDSATTGWLDARLAEIGRPRTGAPAVEKDRPWGTVWRVPTTGGPTWLKRPAAQLQFELPLLAALDRVEPHVTPPVLAVDRDAGLLLLDDAGRSYTDTFSEADLPSRFAAALVEVGRLQRAAAPLVPDLLAAGVADLRPAALPARFDEVVEGSGPFPAEVLAVRPVLVDVCAELAASAVPAAVDHNDLHDGNLLAGDGGRLTVLDWGDSVVSHPFALLLVAQRVLASLAGGDADAPFDLPVVAAARRDYLAVFEGLAPGEDLERTARLAVAGAHVARAWVWQRALAAFGSDDDGGFAGAARDWLEFAAEVLRGHQ